MISFEKPLYRKNFFVLKNQFTIFLFLLFQALTAKASLYLSLPLSSGVHCGTYAVLRPAIIDSPQIDHFIVAGQSNAVGRGDTTQSPRLTMAIGQQFWGGAIRAANDPIGAKNDSLYKGSAWPAFAIRYNQLTGHTVAFVQTAIGATSQVATTSPAPGGTWDTQGTLYNTMIARADSSIAAFKAAGYHVNNCGILWLQGEQDGLGIANGSVSGSEYYQRAIVMINNFRAHYGSKVPFYLIRIGAASQPGHYGLDTIRSRQEQLAKAGYVIIVDRLTSSFVKLGLMSAVPNYNNLHYSQQGYNVVGINAAENLVATYKNTAFNHPSQNGDLANIGLSNAPVTPAFVSTTTNYTAIVASDTTSIFPPAIDTTSVVTVNGTTVPWGAALASVHLNLGINTFHVVSKSQDGSAVNHYTLTINHTVVHDASLSNLAASVGILKPLFTPYTFAYTVAVGNAVSSINLTPTASQAGTAVTVNGAAVISGVATGNTALNVGANVLRTVVIAQDGVTTQTYTITITRAASGNDKLVRLTTSAGGLSPAFNNGVTGYTRSVANSVTAITVTAAVADADATLTVNGLPVEPGDASGSIPLNAGANVISTVVTAQDGVTKSTYTIVVNRAASADASLSDLAINPGTLKPAFTPDNTAYKIAAGNGITAIRLIPTAANPAATIKIGAKTIASGKESTLIPLAVGTNTIATVITAQNGITTKNYKITIIRAPSANAKLRNLTTSTGALSPAFNNTVTSYTQEVPNSVTGITFTPFVVDTTAKITINGLAVVSGTASASQPLAVGSNTENIKITAQDGVTSITYVVTVNRATGPLNSVYKPVGVTDPDLKPNFDDDIIIVRQGLSPNGDGLNDFLLIDGILAYPQNKLIITNRSGQLIFESNGYDNSTKVFDGHSNKTGQMQLPGTYFYSLDYMVNGVAKHKTGFVVLKY